jgi:hypothetical protein
MRGNYCAGPVAALPGRATGNPLFWEWVLSRNSPAERRLSALQPRRLACRRPGSSVRPAPRHPLQLQRVEAPSQPRRLGCRPFRSAMRKGTRLGASGAGGCKKVPCGATPTHFESHGHAGMRVTNEGLGRRREDR